MAALKMYFKIREEHRVVYKSDGEWKLRQRGKVVGPNDIPVKELKYLGQRAVDLSAR